MNKSEQTVRTRPVKAAAGRPRRAAMSGPSGLHDEATTGGWREAPASEPAPAASLARRAAGSLAEQTTAAVERAVDRLDAWRPLAAAPNASGRLRAPALEFAALLFLEVATRLADSAADYSLAARHPARGVTGMAGAPRAALTLAARAAAFVLALIAADLASASFVLAQQPQTSKMPNDRHSVLYVNGVAPGYRPMAGSGLALNLGPGTAFCSGAVQTYAGGSLTLTANATNYIYLNPSASCVPTANTTGFSAGVLPIATAVTGASSITTLSDVRTPFSSSTAGGAGVGTCSANQFVVAVTTTGPTCAPAVIASSAPANQFATALSAGGALSYAQPAFSNLSGTAIPSQLPSATLTTLGVVTLAGDFGGTALVPLVDGLQGNPVASTAPTANQVLTWNGTAWAPSTPTGGGGGSPGGSNTAVQFNNSGAFGGDATNFFYNSSSHGLTITGTVTANSFVTSGAGASYTKWSPTSWSGSVGTVTCGANSSSYFSCSDNAGTVTPMAMIAGDLGGTQGSEQVTGFHLTAEGSAGTQPLTTIATNDTSTGTTNNLLAKLTSTGAIKLTTSDTAIPAYPVVTGGGTSGSAHLAVDGQASCVMDGTASNTEGQFVQVSTSTAGDCHSTGSTAAPSSGWIVGQMVSNSTTSGSAATIKVFHGYNATSGGGGGGTVTTTGSPASGNLAQFSGSTSITNGNLSGDVTTSGTLAATVVKINGTTPGGTCTNQAVTSLSSSAVPTCTTLTSSYVDTSIAKTGTDINTSNQVTATHLASALPVSQGGTGAASAGAHTYFGNNTGSSAPPAFVQPSFSDLSGSLSLAQTPLTAQGDLLYANSTPALARLPIGTSGQCLTSNGTTVAWGACASGSGVTLQTNGTNNSSQSSLNLLNSAATNGLTLTVTNTSAGNVQLGLSGTLANAGLANSSLTLNGTANQITGPGATALGGTATFALANPLTFPGKTTHAASTGSAASLNIPAGTAPTSPSTGDLWNPATSLVFYDGTANRTMAATGSCTNQAVTGTSSTGVSCATLTSSYVDTSIAKTGTDINTSNQVTATHLASGLPIAQGGTGQTSASAAFNALSPLTTEGDLHYYHSSSNTRLAVGTNGQCLTSNGTDPVWGACGGGGSSALSAITAATAANTIGNGDNAQTWQWSLATANKSAFSFGESAASTATGSPFLVNINTLSSSTANPLVVTAGGSANGVKVDTTGKLSAIGTGAINATQCNGGSCGSVTGSGLTSGQLVTGGGSSAIQVGNLSGDVTTSGSTATTVAKVNGVSYPASPSQNTVPIVTGVNTITYMQVPNATLMFSSMTLNGTANQITAPGGIPLGGSGTFAIANPFIFPGKATLAASASGAASLNVPAGTAPSPPSAGDLWNPGSSLVFYDGTANRTLAATGACTNQAVTGTSSTGVSCATITSSYVDTSIAKTGADINTSNQVTATHLASGLPIAQGGTGQTSASAAFNGLSPLTTEGDLLYYHSSANARLGVGTNGQCLVSNGTDPAWSSCSGSAGYSTIQNNGTSVTQRSTLNAAAGLAALDDSTNSRTIVRRPMMSDTTSQLYLREDFTLAGQSVSGAYITAVTHYAVENLSGTGGAVFTAIPPSGYLGVYEIDSGATSGNDSLLQANPSVRADLFPAASSTAETVELAFSLATVANDYHAVGIKIGNGGATYFLGEQGMFCDVTDTSSAGTWACHTIGNSLNKTDVTLSPSQTADTNVHILRIVWTSSTVTFYWDGTQVGTSSTNITTYRLSPAVEAKTNTSGAAATRWYGWSWMR